MSVAPSSATAHSHCFLVVVTPAVGAVWGKLGRSSGIGTSEKSSWDMAFMVYASRYVGGGGVVSFLFGFAMCVRLPMGVYDEKEMALTDADGEGGERDEADYVFDEVGSAGADQGRGLTVVHVIVGGVRVSSGRAIRNNDVCRVWGKGGGEVIG